MLKDLLISLLKTIGTFVLMMIAWTAIVVIIGSLSSIIIALVPGFVLNIIAIIIFALIFICIWISLYEEEKIWR